MGVLAATSWLERTLINAQQEVPRFCSDKKKVDWAQRMQVSFGKGRQTEKCDYVRWHMRMADEHEVGAWEHVYVYDQRNSKELRGGRRYVAEGDTALWFRSGRH